MEYPVYHERRGDRHVVAMMEAVRDMERDNKSFGPNLVRSKRFGELVSQLLQPKHKEVYKTAIRRARQEGLPGGYYEKMLDAITFRTSPQHLKKTQEQMHGLAIAALKQALTQRRQGADLRHINGLLAEGSALALLTRYAHPQVIAFPALPHHEASVEIPLHYDVGVGIDNGDSISRYHLQVKGPCLGRCGRRSQMDIEHDYATSIQIVSAHCDLSTERDTVISTPQLLVNEWEGLATQAEVKRLDVLTDNLLFNMTADLLPRGKVHPNEARAC